MEGFGFKKYLILCSILRFLKASAMPTPQIRTITKHSCWHSVSMAHHSFLLGTDTFTHKPRCGACKGNWCDLSTQRGGRGSRIGRKTVLLVCKTRPAWAGQCLACKFLPAILKQLTADIFLMGSLLCYVMLMQRNGSLLPERATNRCHWFDFIALMPSYAAILGSKNCKLVKTCKWALKFSWGRRRRC